MCRWWMTEIEDGWISFILDIWLSFEYVSGTVYYFWQKVHFKSFIGLQICLCLYQVWQFINEVSKVCYEETQKNGNKHVLFVPRNSCSKIFVNFQFWMGSYQLGVACSMTPIFMNTCIFRLSEIALFYYYLFS